MSKPPEGTPPGSGPLSSATTIGLDWGTSNLRAFLIAADGTVLATRQRPWGILSLPPVTADAPQDDRNGRFRTALHDIAADWMLAAPNARLIACGMVGSAQGWAEAPYGRLPADADSLAAGGIDIEIDSSHRLHLVPGLCKDKSDSAPDVMRGEETQIIGALTQSPDLRNVLMVLPGTHSKWALIDDRRVVDFATWMTGEFYSVLAQHSILGRLLGNQPSGTAPDPAPGAAADATRYAADDGFFRGIDLARSSEAGDLTHQLFSVRTLGLVRQVPSERLRELMSGLLIGHEIISGQRFAGRARRPLVLIGEPTLCERYRLAFARVGRKVDRVIENPAPAGLHRLAMLKGTKP